MIDTTDLVEVSKMRHELKQRIHRCQGEPCRVCHYIDSWDDLEVYERYDAMIQKEMKEKKYL